MLTTAAFAAGEPGRAPLTWGQKALWIAIGNRGPASSKLISIRRVMSVPKRAPSDVDSVLGAISALIERHSSLRTLTHFASGFQEVLSDGKQPVLLVDAGTDDPATTANRIAQELAATLFEHEHELPQRIALVMTGQLVRYVVIIFSHATADFQSAELVQRDLRQLLLKNQLSAPPGPQSATIGLREATDEYQRRSERAVRYWTDSFSRLPTGTFPEAGSQHEPRWRRGILHSAAADTAVRLIAREQGVTSSTVLLMAVAATMARWSKVDVCGVYSMVNNRAIEGHQYAVAKLNQLCLVVVDLAARPGFRAALPYVWDAAFTAYRHSYYDPVQMTAGYAAAGLPYLTGVSPHCYLNDVRLSPADTDLFGRDTSLAAVRDAMRQSTFTLAEGIDNFTWRLRVEVIDTPGGIGLTLTGDTRYLPPDKAELFLRDIEGLLAEAAFREVPWPWTPESEAHP